MTEAIRQFHSLGIDTPPPAGAEALNPEDFEFVIAGGLVELTEKATGQVVCKLKLFELAEAVS